MTDHKTDISDLLINMLKKKPQTLDDLCKVTYLAFSLTERQVKETILTLRECGEVKYNRNWILYVPED